MHVLPRVRELERRHPDTLAVVGVHSGKFAAERDTSNIRMACARLGVEHPVVNDRHFRQWRAYAVQAWPTAVLLDPTGRIAAMTSGEFEVEQLDDAINALIDRYEAAGTLVRGAVHPGGADRAEPGGVLRFPGRVIAADDVLYVADAGHHRVVEVALDGAASGRIVRAFGSGSDGFADGEPQAARFSEPLGLALAGGALFVADRASHAVRRVDLESGSVTTIAGTGSLGTGAITPGPIGSTDLRSPWGLVVSGGTLFVAMAGTHQIWRIDLRSLDLRRHCGSGVEAIDDGAQQEATLAQPTGLACDAETIYFADCESSAVRTSDIRGGRVRTLVGKGLFEFGDRDGDGETTQLEHVQDVAIHNGALLAADTYNNKIKRIDSVTRDCRALPGEAGGGEVLYQPGGVWADRERIFVADTNNHRVCGVDAGTGRVFGVAISE